MTPSANPWVFRGRAHYVNCTSALYPCARGHFRRRCNGKVCPATSRRVFLAEELPHLARAIDLD